MTELNDLQRRLNTLSHLPDFPENITAQQEAATLQARAESLEKRRCLQTKLSTTARYMINRERPSKYWTAINKEKKPRDIIYSLKKPTSEPPQYENRSDKMAELARNYHDNLQTMDAPSRNKQERKKEIKEATTSVKNTLSKDGRTTMNASTAKCEVEDSIRRAKQGKAAGIDGIPYEFWKVSFSKYKLEHKEEKPAFDCVTFLLTAFNDIDTFGVEEGSHFTDGWMCPIYKKKDRREIQNYRPITLLNSDYKMYTKILACCLRLQPNNIYTLYTWFLLYTLSI